MKNDVIPVRPWVEVSINERKPFRFRLPTVGRIKLKSVSGSKGVQWDADIALHRWVPFYLVVFVRVLRLFAWLLRIRLTIEVTP